MTMAWATIYRVLSKNGAGTNSSHFDNHVDAAASYVRIGMMQVIVKKLAVVVWVESTWETRDP